MAPTLHHTASSMTTELRRADRRGARHVALSQRTRIRIPHARITFAESPELFLREEMG